MMTQANLQSRKNWMYEICISNPIFSYSQVNLQSRKNEIQTTNNTNIINRQMFIRKPIFPSFDDFKCNTNNLHQYDPYTNENVIDQDWWDSLPELAKSLIQKRCTFTLGKVDIPHKIYKDNDDEFLANVYYSYLECFDYNNWYSDDITDGPKNVKMIKIDDELKRILVALHNKEEINDTDVYRLSDFKCEINKKMDGGEYFIRLSGTSGKNEKSVTSFNNADDIVKHLYGNTLFVKQEYMINKDSYLIMMKWNEKIVDRYEFRIFVVNNKITGVSQQHWSELFQYSGEELDDIEYALFNIEFIGQVPYETFIGDVYIDMETKRCHLIECNPFGSHCGAGSTLFNWVDDHDLLHGIDDKAEFRYLSIINY